MSKWTKKVDNGQLELMWNFLKFKKDGVNLKDIQNLESLLDDLRTAMLQKTGGQEKYAEKSKGDINIEDVGTIVNCIVIETMHIYLHGGFEKLKEVLK